MKKCIAIVLVALVTLVICMPFSALAEPSNSEVTASSINVSELSDGDLMILKSSIDEELSSRALDNSQIIPEGIYDVGVDIYPGKYLFHSLGYRNTYFLRYRSKDDYNDGVYSMESIKDESPLLYEIEEGYVLEVRQPIYLTTIKVPYGIKPEE